MKQIFAITFAALTCLALSGCGSHYGYGVLSKSSEFSQEREEWITGDYEFQSILYRSPDSSFEIIIQHPIYPLPEPDILISQIGIFEKEETENRVTIQDAELIHNAKDGSKINPSEKITTERFYIVKSSREKFPTRATEKAYVTVLIGGEELILEYARELKWVKRISKWEAFQSL